MLASNPLVASQQYNGWATLGFIRSIASSPSLCQALSTPRWVDLLLSLVKPHDIIHENMTTQVGFQQY